MADPLTPLVGDNNVVFLNDMPFLLTIGQDAWLRHGKAQPATVSIQIRNLDSMSRAAARDDVQPGLDYGKLYKALQEILHNGRYTNLYDVSYDLSRRAQVMALPEICGEISLPKAALIADGGFVFRFRTRFENGAARMHTSLTVRQVRCPTIIGLNPHERGRRQIVVVDVALSNSLATFPLPLEPTQSEQSTNTAALQASQDLVDIIVQVVENSEYRTVEALANKICETLLRRVSVLEVDVSVAKPFAIPSIGGAGVRMRRTRSCYA